MLGWRAWRVDTAPAPAPAPASASALGLDLDGKPLHAHADLTSSSESLRLARLADERSSGKSTRSAGSGYLTMSCIRHEPADDSDASSDRPARPPKPARLSPPRAPPPLPCEYIPVEPPPRCREYELMANFASRLQSVDDDPPPAVPPRTKPRVAEPPPALPPIPPEPAPRPPSAADAVSTDDSLLDELQRDTYCVLRVCEDDPPGPESDQRQNSDVNRTVTDIADEPFSRSNAQRKSNPTRTRATAIPSLKTSNSTSNVSEAGSNQSRPLAERFTPFFLKRKQKPVEDTPVINTRREDNFIGRLTPRFGQSRLQGRGRSLELAPPEPRQRRIERSATTVNIPTRPINSSIVANLKFLSLHRYGAQEEAQCRGFAHTAHTEEEGTSAGAMAGAPGDGAGGEAWRRSHAPVASLLAAASSDIRL